MATAKLKDVLGDHARCREVRGEACQASHARMRLRARTLVEQLPLVHATPTVERLTGILSTGELRCRPDPRAHWVELGTAGKVFLALGVLYPRRIAVLAFARPTLRNLAHETSPWDSGAFWTAHLTAFEKALDSAPKSQQRCERFQRYSLSAPDAWEHVADHVASSFSDPNHYLSWWSHGVTWADPLGALPLADHHRSPFLRSVEVRFPVRVPTTARTLAAVFVPTLAGNQSGLKLRRQLKAWNVPVVEYDGTKGDLEARYQAWIVEWLKAWSGAEGA